MRYLKCQEETEQDQEDKAQAQEEARVEAAGLAAWEAEAAVAVLEQDLAVIAYVPIAAKKPRMNWVRHVTSSNALNAEHP